MNFAAIVERHRRSIIVIILALALAGIFSAISLPVSLFPAVQFPRVRINIDAGDRPADQMALLVTRPVEEAVRKVLGVLHIRSVSSRGSAQIIVDFDWGDDMVSAALQVESAIGEILPSLPSGTNYTVLRLDPTVFPIIAYGLTSDTVDPIKLRDLAQYQLVPLLSAIPGVARVDVQGGQQAEIQVEADPQRLDAYGLSIADVAKALNAANTLAAAGRLEDHYKLYLVISDNSFKTAADVANTVVKSGPDGVVRVRDIGKVASGTVPQWTIVDEDGKPAVIFQVYQQPSANSVQIASAVHKALANFTMPQGVKLANWYDQSVLVTQSAGSVRDAILIGLVLAGIVLFGFLRSWRVTSVAMLVVPATLATTILLLRFLGMSFNIMTLGGLAAAVGLIIDDAIVMIEHIARRAGAHKEMQASHKPPAGPLAALHAAREFMPPLSGSSLATLIVFFPLAFLSGVTGAFFKALSLTMGSALIISYIFTAIAVPVLAHLLIDFNKWQDPSSAPETKNRLGQAHRHLLDRLFGKPWLIAIGLLPLLVLGWIAYSHVGTGFMPAMDEGGFVVDYRTEPGTSLAETNRELLQIEDIIKATPDVQTFSRRTGLGLGGDFSEPNSGDFFVRLKPAGKRRPIEDVMAEIRQKVNSQVPGVNIELAQLMEDLIGDLTGVPEPIEVKLTASDPAKLIPAAHKVADIISKIPGVVEVRNGVTLAGDALGMHIDPAAAALEGVDTAQVTDAVTSYLQGTVATEIPEAHKQVGVRVWLPSDMRQRQSELADLPVRAPDGHIFPLGRVASFTVDAGQPEITRDNLQRMVAVTARIEGRDMGSTITDVKKALQGSDLSASGITYKLGGLYEQQQIAFAGLAKVFIAALVAELILLLFLYEDFWLPVIIIGSSLLSTTAVFTGLWLSGVELNITAMMGMTMIIGISTEMAIFYVTEYSELVQHMSVKDALLEAARNRLRPIVMTSLAAILTLLPLAFAIGQGSAMQQPLAIAIISGLLLQLPLVLLAMPVLIGLTQRKQAGRPL
ncbi:MAG: efflux RND transporter permease subunit [Alphaproteobacteria bacterium]|nr:efflux RND transporter permease subunit [Alphaproteobacteria bacterium]